MGYRKRKRTAAVDELCTCGRLKSSHASDVRGAANGACDTYTFKSHLYASQHLVRRPRKRQVKVRP